MKITKKAAGIIMISAGAAALLSTVIAAVIAVRKNKDSFPEDEPWGILVWSAGSLLWDCLSA